MTSGYSLLNTINMMMAMCMCYMCMFFYTHFADVFPLPDVQY